MKPDAKQTPIAALAATSLAFAALAIPAIAEPDDRDLLAIYGEQRLIEEIYQDFADKALIAGEPLSFELSDFKTLEAPSFEAVVWSELVTMDAKRRLSTRSLAVRHDGGAAYRTFEIEWGDAPSEKTLLESAQRLDLKDRSFAEVLLEARARGEVPAASELAGIRVTSFHVRVMHDAESASYRAAVYWLLGEGSEVDLRLDDRVTPGVQKGFLATELFASNRVLAAAGAQLATQRARQLAAKSGNGPVCGEGLDSTPPSPLMTVSGIQGHVSGEHRAYLSVKAHCQYTSGCVVTCSPTFDSATCSDTGFTGTLIDLQVDRRLDGTSAYMSDTTCAGAQACGVDHCIVCSGFQIGFKGQGPSLSTTASGADYNLGLSQQVTCPPPDVLDSGDDTGEGGGGGDNCDQTEAGCNGSPILLDMGARGFRLSGPQWGAMFDIDANGDTEAVAWPVGANPDAFLALDRNVNGQIDSGLELFGEFSPQPPSAEWKPNGFLALQVYDEPAAGGDGDGWITAEDRIYELLRLWVDRDRDGSSQPGELIPLRRAGIAALGLHFVERSTVDAPGNELRYWSSYTTVDGKSRAMVDVFLRLASTTAPNPQVPREPSKPRSP